MCVNYSNAHDLPPFILGDSPSSHPAPLGNLTVSMLFELDSALRSQLGAGNEASHRRTTSTALDAASTGMVGNIEAAHGVSSVVFLSFSSLSVV